MLCGSIPRHLAVTVVISSPHWSEFIVAGTNIALHPGGGDDETRTGLGFEVEDLECGTAASNRGRRADQQRWHAIGPRSG